MPLALKYKSLGDLGLNTTTTILLQYHFFY